MQIRERHRWRWVLETALVVAVVSVAVVSFGRAQAKQDGDEAEWIGTSRYFLTLFVRHDLSSEAWADSYWTRTQPMVARYAIGAWLWWRGQDMESFDPRYDHFHKWTTNQREGRAPSEAMLAEARVPMRALAVVCALLVYAVVRLAAGPLGGLAAALLFCGSPYLTLHLVRAKGDTTLLVLLLAGLLAGLVAIRRGGARGPGWASAVVTGGLLGLALGAKLTAVLALLAVALWGSWALLAGRAGARRLALWAGGVVAVALVVFVASNPFLYRDPVGRTRLLFENRRDEMAYQASVDPSRAVTSLRERVETVWRRSLVNETWGRTRLRVPVEAVLAVVGAGWLTLRAARPRPGPEAWLLLWAACCYAGVTLGLGYLLDQYFVPTATMGLLLGGVAVGWGSRAVWGLVRRATRGFRFHVSGYPLARPEA